jgi:hypothetical protein
VKELPTFATDEEMIEWFETADLSEYDFEPADLVISDHLTVTVED